MSFRATILIGNKKWKIGIGSAKGSDVAIAVKKATHEAYKAIIKVPVTSWLTVPYAVSLKNKASKIILIPAGPGTGLKAGSSLRYVLELAGYENILSKIVGANNKLNVALTAFKALESYKHADFFARSQQEENKSQKQSVRGENDEDTQSDDTTNTSEAQKKSLTKTQDNKLTDKTKPKERKFDNKRPTSQPAFKNTPPKRFIQKDTGRGDGKRTSTPVRRPTVPAQRPATKK